MNQKTRRNRQRRNTIRRRNNNKRRQRKTRTRRVGGTLPPRPSTNPPKGYSHGLGKPPPSHVAPLHSNDATTHNPLSLLPALPPRPIQRNPQFLLGQEPHPSLLEAPINSGVNNLSILPENQIPIRTQDEIERDANLMRQELEKRYTELAIEAARKASEEAARKAVAAEEKRANEYKRRLNVMNHLPPMFS